MRRMGRWLFNGITALSLALCGAGMVFYALGAGGTKVFGATYLWHEGALQDEHYNWGFRSGRAGPGGLTAKRWGIVVSENSVQIWDGRTAHAAGEPADYGIPEGWREAYAYYPPPRTWLGFSYELTRDTPTHMQWQATAPLWFLTLAAALLPAFRLYRRQRRRRRRLPGCCERCGYDLRATPDRCPECGAVPAEGRNPKPETRINDE